MSLKTDYLGAKLERFLARYTPPRGLNDQAQADEVAALLRALERAAPANGYDNWWLRFEDVLASCLRTRAWPTVGDLTTAADRLPKPQSGTSAAGDNWQEEEALRYQLRQWWFGKGPIGQHDVTLEHCLAIGLTGAQAADAVAFAADPYNHGIGPEITAERRRKEMTR